MKLNLENIKAFLIKNKTYVIIAVVFVVMVFTLVKVTSNNSSKEAKEAGSEEVITVEETTTDTATADTTAATATNDLQTNAYPAVNDLVNKYYTAMASADIDTLLQIVNPLSEEKKAQIQQKKEYIEGYNNVTSYTKVGPEENSYIVFAYYEIKFININTLVPGEQPLYVCTNEDGSLYINEGELTPEVESYIANITAGQDVIDLVKSIDTKFEEAQAADPDLKAFIEKLSGATQTDAAAAEQPAAEQPAAEQPAEEQPAAEQPAVEEAQPEEAAATEQPADTATAEGLQEVDETIYASETANIRDRNSEEGSRLGQLYVGESAKRTGIYSDGWSRIEFNGQTGYILSELITTAGNTQEVKYLSETVTIRAEADENSDRVGTAYEGTKVTRTAELDNGWSRINYDGTIGYVKSEFLADNYN